MFIYNNMMMSGGLVAQEEWRKSLVPCLTASRLNSPITSSLASSSAASFYLPFPISIEKHHPQPWTRALDDQQKTPTELRTTCRERKKSVSSAARERTQTNHPHGAPRAPARARGQLTEPPGPEPNTTPHNPPAGCWLQLSPVALGCPLGILEHTLTVIRGVK